MSKCVLGFVFLLLLVGTGYAFSTTCPNGSNPLAVLTLHYDWSGEFDFQSTCLIACADHTFYTDEDQEGIWNVWEGAGFLKYTVGGKAFYGFSMTTMHGFMMTTNGNMEDDTPGHAYLTPGCNHGYRFSSESALTAGSR